MFRKEFEGWLAVSLMLQTSHSFWTVLVLRSEVLEG